MDKEKITRFTILFTGIVIGFGLLISADMIKGWTDNLENPKAESVDMTAREIAFDCYDENPKETIFCIHKLVVKNFKYVDTNETRDTEKTLKEGGDCEDWSLLYYNVFKELGVEYDAKLVFMEIPNSEFDHVKILVVTSQFYCDIDQIHIRCYDLS